MQYTAFVTKNEIAFPDAPGCQALVGRNKDAAAVAKDALEGWLEAHLVTDSRRAPQAPRKSHRTPAGAKALVVTVAPVLAVKVALRRARIARGMTQAELAARLGVKQPQIAKLEHPDYPSTITSLHKAAEALNANVAIDIELR